MRLSCWLNDWKENRAQNESLGAAFSKDFDTRWHSLEDEVDEDKVLDLIVDYLVNVTQTYPELPHRTGDRF